MEKEIILNDKIAEVLPEIRALIASAPVDQFAHIPGKRDNNLYSTVIDLLSEGTRHTSAQVKYLDAYERALGIFKVVSRSIREEMDVHTLEYRLASFRNELSELEELREVLSGEVEDRSVVELVKQINDFVFFSNGYALAFAGHAGLAMLGEGRVETDKFYSFGKILAASKESEKLVQILANSATQDLGDMIGEDPDGINLPGENPKKDDQLKETLRCIFTSWINQFNWETYKEISGKNGIEGTTIKYEKFSIKDGEFKQKFDTVEVDPKIMLIKKEEVIGDQELSTKIEAAFNKLVHYDPVRMMNPFDPPFVIFTYGNPGGGKTFTAHAFMQSLAEYCRVYGLAAKLITHSTTDYASEYQNKTANMLEELGTEIREFDGIVVMYIADADNLFLSRKSGHLTAEQRQTLAVYFRMFDGTMIPKNGKFMAIMDANYIDGIDDATKSRLFDEIIELKRFDKPKYFAELVKRQVTKGSGGILIPDDDWQEIGEYLIKSPLSNREVGHVVRQLRGDYLVPEELISATWDEKIAYRNEQLCSLNKKLILETYEKYIETRGEIEEASARAKVAKDHTRFLDFLNEEHDPTTTK